MILKVIAEGTVTFEEITAIATVNIPNDIDDILEIQKYVNARISCQNSFRYVTGFRGKMIAIDIGTETIVTDAEVYLMNDSGKTIERIN